MAKKHGKKRALFDTSTPRIRRGEKVYVPTRPTPNQVASTARGVRRHSDGPGGSMSKLARERGAFRREVERKQQTNLRMQAKAIELRGGKEPR